MITIKMKKKMKNEMKKNEMGEDGQWPLAMWLVCNIISIKIIFNININIIIKTDHGGGSACD